VNLSPPSKGNFYTRLDAKARSLISSLVSVLNSEKKHTRRKAIAEKIVDTLSEEIDEADMYPLRLLINVDDNLGELYSLEDYYFESDVPVQDQFSYNRLVMTLVQSKFLPRSYLSDCVETMMRCEAVANTEDMSDIINDHVSNYYNIFFPLDT